ncbi:Uncharacterised protein [Actinobacillus equuli]|nr:Uncharacterised protein [Actinobacillus equuli]
MSQLIRTLKSHIRDEIIKKGAGLMPMPMQTAHLR